MATAARSVACILRQINTLAGGIVGGTENIGVVVGKGKGEFPFCVGPDFPHLLDAEVEVIGDIAEGVEVRVEDTCPVRAARESA